MGRLTLVWLLGVGVPAAPPDAPRLQRFEYARTEMAVPIRIVLYAADTSTATTAATAALARIHQLNDILSDYDPRSELRQLSAAASKGRPVPVSKELWHVLTRAQALAKKSDGAFDVTVGPVVRLWRRARRRQQLPSAERLHDAIILVGNHLIRLSEDDRAVELLRPEMRLDMGGIAKGYAVDEALAVLKLHGIDRALVDAGGDIVVAAPPLGKYSWQVGVAPLQKDGPPSVVVPITHRAIATSGDTWQYVEIDGRRYSHIVDPRTGLGLTDHSSVTVIAADGITADGLASAVSVLGPIKGLELIEATPDAAALIMRAPHGKLETFRSKRWAELAGVEPVQ